MAHGIMHIDNNINECEWTLKINKASANRLIVGITSKVIIDGKGPFNRLESAAYAYWGFVGRKMSTKNGWSSYSLSNIFLCEWNKSRCCI